MSETIILRVRRSTSRRGAITSSTIHVLEEQQQLLRLELDGPEDVYDVDDDTTIDVHNDDRNNYNNNVDNDYINEYDYDYDRLSINRYRKQQQQQELEDTGEAKEDMDDPYHYQHRKVSMVSSTRRPSRSSILSSATIATISNGTVTSTPSISNSTTTTTAYFRRIDSSTLLNNTSFDSDLCSINSKSKMKRPRIIDANLIIHEQDDNINDCRKRPRMTLQIVSSSLSPSNTNSTTVTTNTKYPILSPQQRMMDDSLQQVFIGTITLQHHMSLINEIIHHRNTSVDVSTLNCYWPLTWCHTEYGNWIHAAALWNEAILVQEMFQALLSLPNTSTKTTTLIFQKMLQTQNREGFTPLQVAKLSKNNEIILLLQQLEQQHNSVDGDNNIPSHCESLHGDQPENNEVEEDDDDQYDLYGLVVPLKDEYMNDYSDNAPTDNAIFCNDDAVIASCELHNTCRGYWDERGNLILQPKDDHTKYVDGCFDNNATNVHNKNGDNEDDDDDIDSNDEEWDGNDYPDEIDDDDDDDADGEKIGSDDGDNEVYRPFSRQQRYHYNTDSNNYYYNNDDNDDDDDIDAHYDPSYGNIYGQSDSLYN